MEDKESHICFAISSFKLTKSVAMKSWNRMALMDQLYKDANFKSLKSNSERIEFILNHVIDYDSAKSLIEAGLEIARGKSRKSSTLAKNFLLEAKLYIEDNNFASALVAINQAILHVPSVKMSLRSELYGVKSQIHFDQKDYLGALYSVELSSDLAKCCNLEQILVKMHCYMKLGHCHSVIELLDYIMANPKILQEREDLSVSSFVKIKKNLLLYEKKSNNNLDRDYKTDYFSYKLDSRCVIENSPVVGRHFLAKEDIPKGKVFLKERPYSIVMEAEYSLQKCSSCYVDLKHKFFPCAYCTELVFCDQSCFKQAWDMYHRYECGFLSVLRSNSSAACHVFRMVSRVGPFQAYQVESNKIGYSIDMYLSEARQRNVPELEKDRDEKNHAYMMSSILWDHNDKHNDQTNAFHTVIGLETAIMLDLVHGFRKQRPDPCFLINFVDMIVVDIRRIVFNVFGWHEYNQDWTKRGHVANCQCLVGSLINHSCVPNASWEWTDGVIKFTSKDDIPKGTEITITYGPCKEMSYYHRQERLNHYFFACKCAACLKDAVTSNNLRCRGCNGPVVFQSAVNLESHLNGKCLCCYDTYDNFDQSIKELTEAKDLVMSFSSLNMVLQSEAIFERTIQLVKTIIDLSLPTNESICLTILTCSQIIQKYNLDETHDLKGRIELASLFNRALPYVLTPNLINGKSIGSFKFWFDILTGCMDQLSMLSATGDYHSSHIHHKLVWDGCLLFHQRLQVAIQELAKDEPNLLVQKIVSDQSEEFKAMLDRCKMVYANQASFSSL